MKKPELGLKASSSKEQITNRLKYHPKVFEFFTSENDFTTEGLKRLEYAIELVKNEATSKIVLHHPMRFKGEFTELVAPQTIFPDLCHFVQRSTDALLQLSFDHDVQTLLHGSYARHTLKMISLYPSQAKARAYVYDQLDKYAQLGKKHIMFENSFSPLFYYGKEDEDQYIFNKGYRLAFDVSHCFIKDKGSNEQLTASLLRLRDHVVHYHLVDSLGKSHDSLQLGKGSIDWRNVLPCLNPQASSIYEVQLNNENDAKEQVASHQYLTKIYNELNSKQAQ
ncbi:sugar phosphate isomerase/epimerase [Liquorilactobacillus oeni]|uniref:Xylose isomerase domain containing protein TIM barrel n=1 Tax=Liquorilactobacillus oeni DSM 19972 TaxID=1423777 RepID=A0A0R1M8C0_9LACO|nr:sugar phosphate isomerase/epimerase [Liquorilactobacillus oeni]KRL04382.1 xylose isomerase domain containing protein TIM barrel [Liquorilactobacillus oeni DSM 19972]